MILKNLRNKFNFTIDEIDNMYPFERNIYISLVQQYKYNDENQTTDEDSVY